MKDWRTSSPGVAWRWAPVRAQTREPSRNHVVIAAVGFVRLCVALERGGGFDGLGLGEEVALRGVVGAALLGPGHDSAEGCSGNGDDGTTGAVLSGAAGIGNRRAASATRA